MLVHVCPIVIIFYIAVGVKLSHSEKVILQLFKLLNSEKDDLCIRICNILLIESRISFDSVKTAYDNCHPLETLYKCINSSNTEVREKAQELKSRLDPTSAPASINIHIKKIIILF